MTIDRNRRALLALLATGSMTGTRFALARSPAGVRRIGLFGSGSCESHKATPETAEWFRSLAELGYVEGRNLAVEWRCFGSDYALAARMAAELVRMDVDLLYTGGTLQTRVLEKATSTIPIVTSLADPVAAGFSESLARPGRNITGFSHTHPDTPAKQIELLRRMVPTLQRLALIGDVDGGREAFRAYENAARGAGIASDVRLMERGAFEKPFREMKASGAQAAFIQFLGMDRAEVAKIAIRHGVPTMNYIKGYVEHGGLMSFQMYAESPWRRMAVVIDKVLKGIKPSEIPWELPDRSHLALNLRTAKLLGLTVPSELLVRADQVVE